MKRRSTRGDSGCSPLAQLLQGAAAAHDKVISEQLQLLPALEDSPHPLHVVVEALVDQLEVDQWLVTDLREELQRLPADLQQGEARCEEKLRETFPPLLMVGEGHLLAPSTDSAWAYSSLGQVPVVDEARGDHRLVVPVAAVTVVQTGEGAELGLHEGEADLPGAAFGEQTEDGERGPALPQGPTCCCWSRGEAFVGENGAGKSLRGSETG